MVKLNEISQIKTGLVLSRKKADIGKEEFFKYKVVSLKSFNKDCAFDSSFSDEFITNKPVKEDFLVKKGDILLRLREPISLYMLTNIIKTLSTRL